MRSYLYVPAAAPERLRRARWQGADAVVVDLADLGELSGVEDRGPLRLAVARWLPQARVDDPSAVDPDGQAPADPEPYATGAAPSAEIWLRIAPGSMGHDDVRAVGLTGLRGVVVRTDSTTQLDALDAVLASVEVEAGLPVRQLSVIPVLETAAAVLAASAIARAPRVVRLQLGEADLYQELGLERADDERELLLVRSHTVLASAAAAIAAPIGSIFPDACHPERLRSSTAALRRLGFRARACLDPAQVTVVNQIMRAPMADRKPPVPDTV